MIFSIHITNKKFILKMFFKSYKLIRQRIQQKIFEQAHWNGILHFKDENIWMVKRHWKMLNFISIQENAIKIKISYHLYPSNWQKWSDNQCWLPIAWFRKFSFQNYLVYRTWNHTGRYAQEASQEHFLYKQNTKIP